MIVAVLLLVKTFLTTMTSMPRVATSTHCRRRWLTTVEEPLPKIIGPLARPCFVFMLGQPHPSCQRWQRSSKRQQCLNCTFPASIVSILLCFVTDLVRFSNAPSERKKNRCHLSTSIVIFLTHVAPYATSLSLCFRRILFPWNVEGDSMSHVMRCLQLHTDESCLKSTFGECPSTRQKL